MAEYKTYTCDICGAPEATHCCIRHVDHLIDIADGKTDAIPGYFDVCLKCFQKVLEIYFSEVETTEEVRRRIWKKILSLRGNKVARSA